MQQTLRPLVILAALAGGLLVVAGGQPGRAPEKETAAVTAPAPKTAPKAVRSREHRQVHRKAPKITKRKWEPIPGVRPIPPIAAPERKRERTKVKKKQQQQRIAKSRLPSCAIVRREYERMNFAQKMARYAAATAEEVAHGRRCLGL